MPFNNPPPNPDPNSDQPRKQSSGLQSLVQAEQLMQIAFILPCAMLVGWGLGWLIDRGLHSHWATIAGLVFGLVAGMVSAIRMALTAGNSPKRGGK